MGDLSPEFGALARQENLKEVCVVELPVNITVKKLDEVVAVSLGQSFLETIFSDEVQDIPGCDEPGRLAIDAAKGTIRLKVLVDGQVLSLDL